MPRWVHPEVISRAMPISLGVALCLQLFDAISGVLFHAGAAAPMLEIEAATGGWIHHSLAWGAVTSSLFVVLAFALGVRLRHLGIDRRELVRWIATALIAWCAVQAVVIGGARAGVLPPLSAAASLPESVGIMAALLLHTGLLEEILARGILLPVLVRRLGVASGVSLGALAFALGHLPALMRESAEHADVLASLGQYWFWAMVVGVLYLRSGSLLTLAALHTVRDWPTPFAVSEDVYSALFVALHVGGAAYVWLRPWPVSRRD